MRSNRDPVLELILPTNGGPGSGVAYIDINGNSSSITMFDASGQQVGVIQPGLIQTQASGSFAAANINCVGGIGQLNLYPWVAGQTYGFGGVEAAVPFTDAPLLQVFSPQYTTVAGYKLSHFTMFGQSPGNAIGLYATLDCPLYYTFNAITSATPETWHNATLQNLFTNGTPPLQYRLLASPPNTVQVTGFITSGATVASGTAIATLPAGYFSGTKAPVAQALNASSGAGLWLGLSTVGVLNLHGTWANGHVVVIDAFFSLDIN